MNKILPGKRILKKTLKIFFGIIGGLALLSILLSLTLLIPSVQTYVTGKVTDKLSKKTKSRIDVGGVHIAFPKTVRLSGIFAEDYTGDTLIYCKELNIDVALLPLIRKRVQIDHLGISGLKVNLLRMPGEDLFNYSSILAAFADGQPKEKEEKESAPWDLGFEEIELENIKADFRDHRDSTFLQLDLGLFLVEARQADIMEMKFDLEKITISRASFSMVMPDEKQSQSLETDSASTVFPEVSLKAMMADNISFKLQMGRDNLALDALLKKAEIRPDVIDLNQGDIFINDVLIDGATISYRMNAHETQPEDTLPTVSDLLLEISHGIFCSNMLISKTQPIKWI